MVGGLGLDDGLVVVGLGLIGLGVWLLAGAPGLVILAGVGTLAAGMLLAWRGG